MRDKTGLLVLTTLLALTSVVLWSTSASLAPTMIWTLRLALPAVAICLMSCVLVCSRRADPAPDYLKSMFRSRWECSGMCFGTEPHVRDGVAYLDVYYQNRYERRCVMVLKLTIEAMVSRPLLAQARIDAAGGAFGVARIPMSIPGRFQGRKPRVLLDARTTYPQKRGKMLRSRGGKSVGSTDPGVLLAVAALLGGGIAGLLLAGQGQARRSRIPLPEGVAEELPDGLQPEHEVLWLPGDEVIDLSGANDKADDESIDTTAEVEPAMLPA